MQFRTPRDVARIVRLRRRTLGLDQADLAQRAGVSRQWIIALEQGKEGAALGLVLRTLRALDLSLDAQPAELSSDPAGGAWAHPDEASQPKVDIDAIVERARGPRSTT